MYFIEKVLKLLQMASGGKFYFRPVEGLFAADNLSTFSNYVNLSNEICNLLLPAWEHISVSESDLVNNGDSKKLFAFLPHSDIMFLFSLGMYCVCENKIELIY